MPKHAPSRQLDLSKGNISRNVWSILLPEGPVKAATDELLQLSAKFLRMRNWAAKEFKPIYDAYHAALPSGPQGIAALVYILRAVEYSGSNGLAVFRENPALALAVEGIVVYAERLPSVDELSYRALAEIRMDNPSIEHLRHRIRLCKLKHLPAEPDAEQRMGELQTILREAGDGAALYKARDIRTEAIRLIYNEAANPEVSEYRRISGLGTAAVWSYKTRAHIEYEAVQIFYGAVNTLDDEAKRRDAYQSALTEANAHGFFRSRVRRIADPEVRRIDMHVMESKIPNRISKPKTSNALRR